MCVCVCVCEVQHLVYIHVHAVCWLHVHVSVFMQTLAGIFEKFKEKKLNVVNSLRDAADAVYLTVSFNANVCTHTYTKKTLA